MNDYHHTVLCVDDDRNILQSLKRLLRKEDYRLLTAVGSVEALRVLEESDVHLVISDQRMPEMSGTEFLAKVRELYPDVIRIVLTGYTDVDSITEAVNKGHIYKFILKPWNDQNLRLEIRQALEQFELIQSNKGLNKTVIEQNEKLRRINENLEELVEQRTRELEIQNQALELSRAILDDLPLPVIGVSNEMMIVMLNGEAQTLFQGDGALKLGCRLSDYFSTEVAEKTAGVFSTDKKDKVMRYRLPGATCDIHIAPLSGRFRGQGVVLILKCHSEAT